MRLYLLRHGRAAPRDPARATDDEHRALTRRGEEQVRMVGRSLRRCDHSIDLIWFSPLVRARQTAIILAEECATKECASPLAALSPGGDQAELLGRIDALDPRPASLMLVGHEPDLSQLISFLVDGSAGLPLTLKKGGLARLEITAPIVTARCATLEWLIPPRLFTNPA